MQNSFSLVTADTIKRIIEDNLVSILNIVHKAYESYDNNNAVNPPSYFLRFPDKPLSRIIALPAAIIDNPRVSGIKWISSNPDNVKTNLKRASAVIILNDYETGYPIACLEGGIISAIRTALSAILCVHAIMKHKKINALGIIGTGILSSVFLKCLKALAWKIDKIYIYDTNKEYAEGFINKIFPDNSPFSKVEVCEVSQPLIQASSLIFTATTANTPHIHNFSLFSHNPIILNISLRDLAPVILSHSNNIVDDITHVLNANTSPHLAQLKYGHIDFINGTIGELLKGKLKLEKNKPTVISPMGLGILDIAVAEYVFSKAKLLKQTIEIDNFIG